MCSIFDLEVSLPPDEHTWSGEDAAEAARQAELLDMEAAIKESMATWLHSQPPIDTHCEDGEARLMQQQSEVYANLWTGAADEEELEEKIMLSLLLG